MGERASAPTRLIGQDRFGAVLFSSTDNPSGEDIGKRWATRQDLLVAGGPFRTPTLICG
jgi:hypothetical protein